MATRRAIANGNWSATGTWNGGVVPTAGDTVYANGVNVTIDQNVTIGGANNPSTAATAIVAGQYYTITFVGTTSWTTIGAASNTLGVTFLATATGSGTGTATALATISTLANTAAGAAAGGNFAITTANTINTDIRAGTTACLTISGTGNMTFSGLNIIGGTTTGANSILNNSTGTLLFQNGCNIIAINNNILSVTNAANGTIQIISSNITAGVGSTAYAINNAGSSGSIVIQSSAIQGSSGTSSSPAINNASSGSVTISSSTLTGVNSACVANATNGSVTISSSTITAGNGTASCISNASTGTLICTSCTFTASAFANAVTISSTGADVRLSGDFLDDWSGWKAVTGGKWRLGTAPTFGQTRYALAGTSGSYFTEYGADYAGFGNPIAADVRSGVSYGGGNLTGTCAVPAPSSVAAGVAVDATTGTAILTASVLRSALGLASANLDTQLASLSNLDATVSSRLATSGYTAPTTPPTAAANASAVWSAATRTITGGTVDTLTNAPTVPSASAIASQVRTELTTELGRIDAAISTRTTPANIPSADIAAIKAVTDDLDPITERLANVATTNIVGTLLAQSQS